ncbi:uncharacterized protein TNCV_5002741 [Trichonephila clavipes]|nr:uncharacterized protein TNCV_5002741 [Trichonephila clavipes]
MIKLHCPSNLIVSGPSQSGKTSLVQKLISEQVYEVPMKNIVWCFKHPQNWFLNEKNFKFVSGLPSEAEEENCDLIVLDDTMNDVTSEISQMFTMGSDHKKYSIILITQNLFPRVKSMRDISLNAHYIILFRNNRDVSQAACFRRQAFPGRGKFFMESYKKATEEPFSYLLVDVHPRSPEVQRLRKSLFPDHGMINWVFVPKEK